MHSIKNLLHRIAKASEAGLRSAGEASLYRGQIR